MTESHLREIEKKLADVPPGKLFTEDHFSEHSAPIRPEEISYWSDGKGLIELWIVFPGVSLTHSTYRADSYIVHHAPHGSILQINHCRRGRIGWKMCDGINIYLGPGDLSVHTMEVCGDAVMNFPLGCYEGIAMFVDFGMLEADMPEALRDAGIDGKQFHDKFCGQRGYTAVSASSQIDHIFSELYTLPPHMQVPYFKLKVQELLLFLSMLELEKEKELDQFYSQQIEAVQAIHRQLTEHLEQRYTITQLSRQYLMNTTTLKAIFKRVYGAPIAAYMKEYRVRQAAQLLRDTTCSVAEIAERVGYENQSKFTSAFRSVLHLPPTAYRKQSSPKRG